MNVQVLSVSERSSLLLHHKRERDGRVRDRIKAVILRDDGWTYEAIAEALLLSEEGVRQHLKDYAASGKLKPQNGGSEGFLNEAQALQLLTHLESQVYVKVMDICAYVQTAYGIRYSVRGMTDWLHRHDFTYHQPCGVPAKADAEAQKAFVAKYEALKANLSDEDQILFLDGVHPSHMVRFVRGWIRKGQRKEIPTNASQKRLNILGALNLETMTLHRQEFDTLNAQSAIQFLTYLLSMMPCGILHVILDRGRYLHCAAVWEFAVQNPRLKLHYLPPYSPNINAIEPAWKIMHEHTTQNAYHATFKHITLKNPTILRRHFPAKCPHMDRQAYR